MKKKIIPFLLLLIVSVMASCEKDLDVYEGESGIFFDTKNTFVDTLMVHWGQLDSDVKDIQWWLKVNLIGDTKDYDRHFQIAVTTDEGDEYAAKEGRDYVKFPTDYVIKAGENETYIYFTLLRDADLAEKPKRFKVFEFKQISAAAALQAVKRAVSFMEERTRATDGLLQR